MTAMSYFGPTERGLHLVRGRASTRLARPLRVTPGVQPAEHEQDADVLASAWGDAVVAGAVAKNRRDGASSVGALRIVERCGHHADHRRAA